MSSATVAVTGAAGYLGGRLVRNLCADDRIERVLAFDVRPSSFAHANLLFDVVDVRNPALRDRLGGVDVVVHLAFVMDPLKDEAAMRDINVNGSQNVFRCAGAAGVGKVVYTSSATVYGAHPDNDFPLTEDSPLRANLDFSYSAHKLEVEYVIREVADDFPGMTFTVFRPAIVFGSHVDNAWSHVMEMPVIWGVKGYSPPFQFVHEDDVAAALEFAVHNHLDGIYNLAPDDWVSSETLLTTLGRRRVDLPEPAAFSLAERLWSAGLAEAPAGMLHYVMHPWVVAPSRLEDAGFTCSRGSMDAFSDAAAGIRSHIRLGRTRIRRRDLAAGTAAGLGLVGALAGIAVLRRRRS